jgi:hypothetical protein
MDMVRQVISDEPVPPQRLNPAVDRILEPICLKCLEKNPARRYSSALTLQEELQRYLDGEPILVRPASTWERAINWVRRLSGATWTALICVLLALITLSAAHRNSRFEPLSEARSLEVSYAAQIRLAQQNHYEEIPVWSVDSVALLSWLRAGGNRRSYAVAFNPDSREVVTGSTDGQIRLWDLQAGKMKPGPGTPHAHNSRITCLAVSPDGRRVASGGGRDCTIVLCDATSWERLLTLCGQDHEVTDIAFS